MELIFTNYSVEKEKIDLSLEPGKLYGFNMIESDKLLKAIQLKKLNRGQIILDGETVNKENILIFRKKISIIKKVLEASNQNIYQSMNDYIIRNKLQVKDPEKKIKDSLKIVGLREEILNENISDISSSEKKLFQIALSLLSNPELIIIEEPFKVLDKQTEKRIVMLFQRLRDQFKKTIILISKDSDTLYKYTNEIYFIKNNKIIVNCQTKELHQNIEILTKNKFNLPDIVEFTYLAKKKKNVKIDYHNDVRDIIKDIYKHI